MTVMNHYGKAETTTRVRWPSWNFSRAASGSFVLLLLGACAHNVVPGFSGEPYTIAENDSMIFTPDQLTAIRNGVDAQLNNTTQNQPSRNAAVAATMYLIDQAYYDYETRLTHDDQFLNAIGPLATFATTAVASVIPAGEATKSLSAVATGINGGTNMIDQKVLLSQTMQSLQSQMRADRDTQAAIILSRMNCPYSSYPIGMAYSDLESYARAGTLSAALLGLSKTASQNQKQAATAKAAASAPGADGAKMNAALATQSTAAAKEITEASTCPIKS